MAAVLSGSWRGAPPPLELSAEELDEAAPLLLRTGGAGLGWWRLAHTPLADSRPAQELHQVFRLFTLHAALQERRIAKAFSLLRAVGVEPLLGKGWAVARLYPSLGLRPCGDVDLYVRPEQHAAAEAALRSPDVGHVDLHRGFAELDDRSVDELYRRSELLPVEGVEVRVFGPEDHLRLLSLHMLRHGVLRPLWLCDVALTVESRPAWFDWDCFAGGNPRRSDWAACALALARELLEARLDEVPLPRARSLPRWLVPAVLKEWSAPRPPHGSRTPMAQQLGHPRGVLAGLSLRWPNAVEATVHVGGPFNDLPRLPFQIADGLLRSAQFVSRLRRLV